MAAKIAPLAGPEVPDEFSDPLAVPSEPTPAPELPRAVGDVVRLRSGDAAKNGLNPGELCTVAFANVKYGNYKLKRASDEKEFYW